jgi:hypothetical protein
MFLESVCYDEMGFAGANGWSGPADDQGRHAGAASSGARAGTPSTAGSAA